MSGIQSGVFSGEVGSTAGQQPYPLQLMLGVFDFPERQGPERHAPELGVDWVRGSAQSRSGTAVG